MVLPELGPGVWIGIGFGILGISFWIGGLLAFNWLVDRYGAGEPPTDAESAPPE